MTIAGYRWSKCVIRNRARENEFIEYG